MIMKTAHMVFEQVVIKKNTKHLLAFLICSAHKSFQEYLLKHVIKIFYTTILVP